MKSKSFYRRILPHLQPAGACFFVTFRLKDSIPVVKLTQLKAEYDAALASIGTDPTARYRLQKHFFQIYDQLLDRIQTGPTFLGQPEIAALIKLELHTHDGTWYDLLAYCIMPNHVHLLIDTSVQLREGKVTTENVYLHQIMHKIKGATARSANLTLNRTGKFWQRESYDHMVRDERELLNIISYIVENPVKAGLVGDWKAWAHSYWKSSSPPLLSGRQTTWRTPNTHHLKVVVTSNRHRHF